MARVKREGMRADKFLITGIKNMKRGDGTYIMEGRSRLVKEVDHYTITCPECETEGRIDEHGEVVCDNEYCSLVLTGPRDPPLIYPEDDYAGNNGDSTRTRSASGHPLMRVPALRDAGPGGDDAL